ncbi:MAG: type II toxin-antitoxin system VapB family antitoxin [Burkholderiaceae bacterium]|jgi:antitoxin VapB|nr:type II toxin-antitoxin system VapB family antitoxin [Burkholderiaceae bacterium]
MHLQIKNPRAHDLASKIAEQCHVSMTEAVVQALETEYRRMAARQPVAGYSGAAMWATPPRIDEPRASVQELLAIADEAAACVQRPYADHADLLYDESGLPR